MLKYTKVKTSEKKTDTIQNFVMRIKRGSKRFRLNLGKKATSQISPNITKYAELTNTVIGSDASGILNSSCGFWYLQNILEHLF